MAKEIIPVCHWSLQQDLVKDEVVAENMDRMALTLTGEKRIRDAWRAIFLKPPKKSWSDTVVAIKSNNIGHQHTRSAVMRKVCNVLVHEINVKGSHILIYDGIHGNNLDKKSPFKGLPKGCRIMNQWGGVNTPVPIPAPWKGGRQKVDCLKNLAEGDVDILVNIGLCKGHAKRFGGFTMTMKNHFGTFDPKWGHRLNATDYLLGVNKTPEILGPMDSRSGNVTFPRQQLCLIDALWASEDGPVCDPSCQPNRLFMGVFSPVLDYLVATRFRKEIMGWSIDGGVTSRILNAFGYTREDLPGNGQILDAMKA